MNIDYKLYIGNLHTLSASEDFPDAIFRVEYTYTGSTFIKDRVYSFGLTKSVYVLDGIEDLDKSKFTDFSNITEPMVREWVLNALGEKEIEAMKAIIKNKIEADSLLTIRTAPWVEITQGVPSQEPPLETKK